MSLTLISGVRRNVNEICAFWDITPCNIPEESRSRYVTSYLPSQATLLHTRNAPFDTRLTKTKQGWFETEGCIFYGVPGDVEWRNGD